MCGRQGIFRIAQHLFVEFLARTQSRVDDPDVLIDPETRQCNHPPGQFGDLDALAHIEDEDRIAAADRRGLHHQPARLGNRHEVAPDLGMRHRHGAAVFDLLAETRDDRPVRPQHVAEAGGDELRAPFDPPAYDRLSETLYIDFGQPFGTAHDVGRIHGLVRRNHHHLLHAVANATVRHVARSDDVDQHRFAGILLHERHVLVGRGMEYHLGPIGTEDEIQPFRNPHVADHGDEFQIGKTILHFEAYLVHRRLGVVEQDQLPDAERRQLAAQLRSDRTGSTRHQHGFVAEIVHNLAQRNLYLLASQQVFDLDVADTALMRQFPVDDLVDRRGDQHLDAVRHAIFDQAV